MLSVEGGDGSARVTRARGGAEGARAEGLAQLIQEPMSQGRVCRRVSGSDLEARKGS